MRLQYEIAVDSRQLKTALRGVEGEITRSARAANRAASPARQTSDAARVAKAKGNAEAAEARRIEAAKRSLDRQRHQALMGQARERQRAEERGIRENARAAAALDRQRSRGLRQQFLENERSARRSSAAGARTVASVRQGAARTIGGSAGALTRFGGMALGVAGGFATAVALEEELSIGRRASQLANQAGTPGAKGALASEARNVRGFTGTEALSGVTAFVD